MMEGRNGFVSSLLNLMFGRGGVAGDATTTSRQGCGESTSRQLRRKMVIGSRAVTRRVEKKKRDPKVRRQREKSFESRLSGFVNKEEKQGRRGKVARPEEKVVWRKNRAWKWRRSSRMVKTGGSWMRKERGCRRSCETL